jgi:tetratricopeptide (TPR) repeat protein
MWRERVFPKSWRGGRDVWWLLAIVALAVSVRAAYWLQFREVALFGVAVGPDVKEYDGWARQILGGQYLWRELPIHGPLYAYFLAFWYRVTGMSIPAVRALQLGLDVVSMLCVMAAARRLWGWRVAGLVGGIWALYLPLVYYSAELFSEGLLVFCFSLVLALLALVVPRLVSGKSLELRHWLVLVATGGVLGLAALTHALSLLASAALVATTAVLLPRVGRLGYSSRHEDAPSCHLHSGLRRWLDLMSGRFDWRLRCRVGVLLLAGLLIVLLPVTAWNWHLSRELVLVQAREGLNLYIGNNPQANGTCNVRPGKDYQALLDMPRLAGAVGEKAAKRFYRGEVIRFVLRNPQAWGRLLVRKALLTWNRREICSGPDLPELQALTPLMRLPFLSFAFLGPLALAGCWASRRQRASWLLLAVVVAYAVALTVFVTSGRYRLGMIPALIVLAALALAEAWCCWREKRWRELGVSGCVWALGLLVSLGVAPPPFPGSAAESAHLLAEASWRQGDLVEAERWLGVALPRSPQDSRLHQLQGVVLAEKGRHSEAVQAYERALQLAPALVQVRVDLAISLVAMGRVARAESELRKVVSRAPDSADAHYNLGVLAEGKGEWQQALECYRRALAANPAHVSAGLNAGLVACRLQDWPEAERRLRVVLRLDRGKAKAWNGLAVIHASRQQLSQAVACFRKSLALDPTQKNVWLTLASMLEEAGDAAAAETARRRAAKL